MLFLGDTDCVSNNDSSASLCSDPPYLGGDHSSHFSDSDDDSGADENFHVVDNDFSDYSVEAGKSATDQGRFLGLWCFLPRI